MKIIMAGTIPLSQPDDLTVKDNATEMEIFIRDKTKLGRLYSFFEKRGIEKYGHINPFVIIDSGAFSWNKETMHSMGAASASLPDPKIHLRNLIEFIRQNAEKPYVFVELDIYRTLPKKLIDEAYDEIKSIKGNFKIIRVYHHILDNGDLSQLKKWIDEGQTYIGLGPSTAFLFKKIFNLTKNTIKYHYFAGTTIQFLLDFPFYTADSTTYLCSQRYGNVFYIEDFIKMKSIRYTEKINLCHDLLDPFLFKEKDGGIAINRKNMMRRNILIFDYFQQIITNLWKERGVEWND